jgi:hypothetical protein
MHVSTANKTMDPGYICLIVIACLCFIFGVGMCSCVLMKKRAAKEAHYTTLYDKATNGDGDDVMDEN